MIKLEQTLQDLHIDEQENLLGKQWHSLSVDEVEHIKKIFIEAGFVPPQTLADMTPGLLFYTKFAKGLAHYAGDAVQDNLFDQGVYAELLNIARVAAGLITE